MNDENVTYFDSFGVEVIPIEIKKVIRKKNNIAKIYRIQLDNVCILLYWIYHFMLKGKSFLDYNKLLSPNKYEEKNKIIKKISLEIDFKKVTMRKIIKSVSVKGKKNLKV